MLQTSWQFFLKNHGRALDIPVNFASAATRIHKAALSTLPDVISFYQTGNGFCQGKFA